MTEWALALVVALGAFVRQTRTSDEVLFQAVWIRRRGLDSYATTFAYTEVQLVGTEACREIKKCRMLLRLRGVRGIDWGVWWQCWGCWG